MKVLHCMQRHARTRHAPTTAHLSHAHPTRCSQLSRQYIRPAAGQWTAKAEVGRCGPSMDSNSTPTPEEVREALVQAFTNGRKRMPKPTVVPVVDRVRPRAPPDLYVEELELCSEPDHPHGQGWVPLRVMWKPSPAPAAATPTPTNTGNPMPAAATGPQSPSVAAALTATMAVTPTSPQAAFLVSLDQARSARSTPTPTSTHIPDHSTPQATLQQQYQPPQVDITPSLGHEKDGSPLLQPTTVSHPHPAAPPPVYPPSPADPALLTDMYTLTRTTHPHSNAADPHLQQQSAPRPGASTTAAPTDQFDLTQQEQDELTYEARIMAQARAAAAMHARLNAGRTASAGGSVTTAALHEWLEPAGSAGGAGGSAGAGAQGTVTQSLAGPAAEQRRPVVILLHSTGSNMNRMASEQEAAARAGYLAVTVDCRYHGERCVRESEDQDRREVYQNALVRAWREGSERPFLLDNLWDLSQLLDYLVTRPDVDPTRIGITGVSLGGMHAWLMAVADDRIAVTAPMIGVQYFGWAVDNTQWHARVDSIPKVFAAAAADLGKSEVDSEVVKAVWDKLLPGLLTHYDAPYSLPTLAPRPVLIANGELDPRCPMRGVLAAYQAVQASYCDHHQVQLVWCPRGVGGGGGATAAAAQLGLGKSVDQSSATADVSSAPSSAQGVEAPAPQTPHPSTAVDIISAGMDDDTAAAQSDEEGVTGPTDSTDTTDPTDTVTADAPPAPASAAPSSAATTPRTTTSFSEASPTTGLQLQHPETRYQGLTAEGSTAAENNSTVVEASQGAEEEKSTGLADVGVTVDEAAAHEAAMESLLKSAEELVIQAREAAQQAEAATHSARANAVTADTTWRRSAVTEGSVRTKEAAGRVRAAETAAGVGAAAAVRSVAVAEGLLGQLQEAVMAVQQKAGLGEGSVQAGGGGKGAAGPEPSTTAVSQDDRGDDLVVPSSPSDCVSPHLTTGSGEEVTAAASLGLEGADTPGAAGDIAGGEDAQEGAESEGVAIEDAAVGDGDSLQTGQGGDEGMVGYAEGSETVNGEEVAPSASGPTAEEIQAQQRAEREAALAQAEALLAQMKQHCRRVEQHTQKAVQAAEAACEALRECEAAAARAEGLALVNSRLVLYVEPGAGHEERPGMWRAVRAFLDLHLRGCSRQPAYAASIHRHTHPILE